MRVGIKILCFFCFQIGLFAQQNSIDIGSRSEHVLERLMMKYDVGQHIHNGVLPLNRSDLLQVINSLDTSSHPLNLLEQHDIKWIYAENGQAYYNANQSVFSEEKKYKDSLDLFYTYQRSDSAVILKYKQRKKPLLKYFYRTAANLFEIDKPNFSLRINPILNLKIGSELGNKALFKNQRGIEIRGSIDKRVFFYSNILETQESLPSFVDNFIEVNKAIPGQGFYKNYQSSVLGKVQGVDYLNSAGSVSVALTDKIAFSFGHDKHKIGHGVRSMMLSDFSNNYLFFRINTKVWKFHYQNLFAELTALGPMNIIGDKLLPKKYMAAHYLSIKPNKNLEIGLFESIIFSRDKRRFEFQYLNPIILYRTVEQSIGSQDNILLGLNSSLKLGRKAKIYGQIFFDEFILQDYLNDNKSWTKKYAGQIGLKYIDVFQISHLDMQIEFNAIRPYTFAHRDSVYTNYGHYNQPLSHPLGSNLKEGLFKVNYQPRANLTLSAYMFLNVKGIDEGNNNWGGNIFKPTYSRNHSLNNKLGQGTTQTLTNVLFNASYMLFHNAFIDLTYQYRNLELDKNIDKHMLMIGYRMNIGQTRLLF